MSKIIYPDYEYHDDGWKIGIMTHVRKQRDDGVWCLIPVVKRFESNSFLTKNGLTELDKLNTIKRFHHDCYNVVLFYKLHPKDTLINPEYPWIKLEEEDENQKDEYKRLHPYHYKKVNINTKIL